jgi:PHD/YefM family antitoxin component YafN of YafNO toxin-antitoxin module
MLTISPKYITDQVGNKISVVISVPEFESIMEKLEEIEDVQLYDKVKQSDELSIPIDEAFEC